MPNETQTPHPPHKSSVEHMTKAISDGTLRMRPKWRFWLQHGAVALAIMLVAVSLVYVGSLIEYLWRSARLSSLPAFGPDGYGLFVQVFPWWEVLFVILGVIAFFYLVRRHTHVYRWPLVMIFGVFALAFIIAAVATDSTRLHDRLVNRYMDHGIPFVGTIYHGHEPLFQSLITPGRITKITTKQWTIKTDDDTLKVKISKDTNISADQNFTAGDIIVVVGKREGNTITAVAIRPAERLPHHAPFWFDGPPPMPDNSYDYR